MTRGTFVTSMAVSTLLYLFAIQYFTTLTVGAAAVDDNTSSSNNEDSDMYRNLLLNQLQSELDTNDDGTQNGFSDYFPPQMYGLMKRKNGGYCLRRGASCDNHPNDCCYRSSCRCNLFGVNCRCSRIGLLQKFF